MKDKKIHYIRNSIVSLILICIFSIAFPGISTYASQYREQTDINNFDSNRYPGYKERIIALKAEHPNWNFTFFYTGLDWNTVVYNETSARHGRSLVQTKSGEWRCTSCGDKVYDGVNWYCASVKALSYYLDPRNFLYTDQMFQFETLSYVEGAYTEAGIETILNGTFMHDKSIKEYYNNEEYTEKKFSTVIMEAGKTAGVSPYHLASRIKQEIIVSGGGPSGSATGTVEEYVGLYNFYNIGATSGQGAIQRGLTYAQNKGWNKPEIAITDGASTISSNYIGRGQNTLYLEKFDIDSSDNSLYSHQYMQNIEAPASEGKKVYNAYLNLGMIESSYNFVIPVFENMPTVNSEWPRDGFYAVTENVQVNTNGTLVKAWTDVNSETIATLDQGAQLLRIEQNEIWNKVVLADGRKGYIETKFLNKIDDVITANDSMYVRENVNLRNGPGLDGTTIMTKLNAGTLLTRIEAGKYELDGYVWDRVKLLDGSQGYVARYFISESANGIQGEVVKVIANGGLNLRQWPTTDSSTITLVPTGTLLTRLEKNVATANDLVWDKVKTINGTEGYVASKYIESIQQETAPISTDKCKIDENNKIVNCAPILKVKDIKETYKDKGVIIKSKTGEEITDIEALIGTGMQISIGNVTYQAVKYGDVSGDGIADARDSLRILKYVVGDYNLDEKIFFYAADINKDNVVDARDSLRILKYVVGEFEINP